MKTLHLESKQTSTKSDHALAAANIRRELKHAFPGQKFSVRSDSYSGGDSVSIHWTLGPTTKEIDAFTSKYQEGTFNGMIDLYEYDADRTFTSHYGSVKYVLTQRDCSTARQAIEKQLSELYHAENAYDLQTSAWRILSKYSFPVDATVTGVEHTQAQGGLIEDVFRPTFVIARS